MLPKNLPLPIRKRGDQSMAAPYGADQETQHAPLDSAGIYIVPTYREGYGGGGAGLLPIGLISGSAWIVLVTVS